PAAPTEVAEKAPKHRLFGGKRELEDEVAQLRATVESMGIPERDALRAEVAQLQAELPSLRTEKATLEGVVVPLRSEVQGLEAAKAEVDRLHQEAQLLTAERDR